MIEEGLLGAEELLSMADFQETGATEQLLAPDLTKKDKNNQKIIIMSLLMTQKGKRVRVKSVGNAAVFQVYHDRMCDFEEDFILA